MIVPLAEDVAQAYSLRPVTSRELLEAGLKELYESAGRKLPPELTKRLDGATDPAAFLSVVVDARVSLGKVDELTVPRAFVVAAKGFTRATDAFCGLSLRGNTSPMSSDAEFGLGFELDGATGEAWLTYVLGTQMANQAVIPSPASFPWHVTRVIPGSPASRAGMRVGDVVTHVGEQVVDAKSHNSLFRLLAAPTVSPMAQFGQIERPTTATSFRVKREGAAVAEFKLLRDGYTPESIFGVTRRENGLWDFLIDREAKIGYVRVGVVEPPAGGAFEEAVTGLIQGGAAGLVLDLRWCPGGYINPAVSITDVLLPPGKVIVNIQTRKPEQFSGQPVYVSKFGGGTDVFYKLPLVVLVNHETTGGGEMIAAALQDHGRGLIVGQRTFGKANVMNVVAVSLADGSPTGLGFRVSTGFTLRPNGKNRHRFADSKPGDPWGVKPNRGFEMPTTPDLSARLRAEAEQFAARPAGSRNAVPYDDPLEDPQRLMAVRYLKELIRAADKKSSGEKK
ncbi:carboxyl-terminal protease [Fimbriiglobus ruber]|uniref:Carboxyl-terminal protease n=2 Tax=Fimbriiglobus ruber TaxID=1908690 RepID=A0A225DSL7_9BACT|nr:carboxyl-terminal protease [Fimbriiglobus ruber]